MLMDREMRRIHQRAVQIHLHVARAFGTLQKMTSSMRLAGVHQRSRHDGERAALLDVARRAEKALRLVQCVRVHAAGQNFPECG